MKKFTFFSLNRRSVSFLLFVFVVTFAFAQNPYIIQFQDETIEMPENISTFQWDQMPESSQYDNGYYGWVQFYETPSQNVQDLFAANNLELISYIPHRAYAFYFPANTSISFLREHGVRSIVPVEGRFKLSQPLKNGNVGDWAVVGDQYLVTLQFHKHANAADVINDLATKQISVREQYTGSNNIDLIIPNNCLEDLSNQPYVKWVEVLVAPSIPDDIRGRSIHRANLLDSQTDGGRNYNGEGVGVLCRDDGAVGPHIDFQGRIFGSVGANSNGHGDGVSGIMAGAGNLNPKNRGMAAGSTLWVVNYVASFLDAATNNLINGGDVQVTNSSYSNGCNAGYTTITQTVDTQVQANVNLMHVFSAGNSNGLDCGYGAGSQWGNITGGHKQGKNVIATANLRYDGTLEGSSSRGPAHDGRIKPDISAHGQGQVSTNQNHSYQTFGGTSAAAPGIAGCTAMIYSAYMDTHSGNMPPSAVVKAALLNTANDYGNVGPDFKYGWGLINANKASLLVEEDRFLSSTISNGGTNNHSIVVPSGTTQVRFMVYWVDEPASPGANPALVNDLDLVVTDPGAGTHLPYVLDHTPNPVNLDTPATNGPDHLNNVEQVLINNPAAGTYNIEISGFNVPVGPQEYYVVYQFDQDNLTLVWPNGGETLLVPNADETIHWDAINTAANFTLEYSLDNGGSWNAIATVGSTETNYDWDVPTVVTGEALVRITSGSYSDTSDDVFSIAGLVSGLSVSQVCETDATFDWNPLAGVEMYDLYVLGAEYMEVAGSTAGTEITVPIPDGENEDIWYAVAGRNDTDGWETIRSTAIRHNAGLLNCDLGIDDIALSNISLYPNPASDQVQIALGNITFESFGITVTNSLGQTIQTLGANALNGSTEATINVSSFRTGLYFVTIEMDGQSTTKKLVVR